MTVVVARRRARRTRPGAGCVRPVAADDSSGEPTLFDDRSMRGGAEPTLDELVSGVWEGLVARRRVSCPLCDGEMEPVSSVDGQVLGGRCGGCGTALAALPDASPRPSD